MTTVQDTQIPAWPHPVVTAAADGAVTVDDELVVEPDPARAPEDTRALAIAAIVARYAGPMRRPVLIDAVDPSGLCWQLAVHPDGEITSLFGQPQQRTPESRRKRNQRVRRGRRPARPTPAPNGRKASPLLTPALVLGGVLGIGGLIALAATQGPAAPVAARPGATTASAVAHTANLPVPAPAGFTTAARWAVSLNPNLTPVVADSGLVAVVTADNRLTLLDPRTGATRWSVGVDDGLNGQLQETVVDGHRVIALATNSTITTWAVDGDDHSPQQVTIPASGLVSFAGRSPLVVLPDQTVGLIDHGQASLVDVPVGATAIAADGPTATAVDTTGRVWSVAVGRPARRTGQLPAPTPQLTVTAALQVGDSIAATWAAPSGGGTRVVVAQPGRPALAATDVAGDGPTDPAAIHFSPTRQVAGFDNVVVDARARARIVSLPEGQTVAAVTGTDVWSNDTNRALIRTPLGGQPDRPVADGTAPLGVAAGLAFVQADKLDQRLLYALPPG